MKLQLNESLKTAEDAHYRTKTRMVKETERQTANKEEEREVYHGAEREVLEGAKTSERQEKGLQGYFDLFFHLVMAAPETPYPARIPRF